MWVAVAIGCTPEGELRRSTVESSSNQLETAGESGHPTEIIAVDEPLDAREAMAEDRASRGDVTYLVLTSTDAQIVWSEALRHRQPMSQAAVIGRWVAPYLRFGDTDTALKAFVFAYLEAMHAAGLTSWSSAIVPFLPPGPKKVTTAATSGWGAMVALGMFLLVVWANRRGRL